MSYNVTISGTEYEGIEKVQLPITDENAKATFYSVGIEDFLLAQDVVQFESDINFGTYSASNNNKSNGIRAYAFYSCQSLQRVSLPNAISLPTSCFDACIALKDVNIPSVSNINSSCFAGCSALEELKIPVATAIPAKLFNNCTSLKKVDCAAASVDSSAFNNCVALEALIMRRTTVATLKNVNAFLGTPIAAGASSDTCHIYVPSALVDSYKTATNWSTFASQIRAIEDYPDICG